MGDLSSGCGCGRDRDRMGNNFDCCSIIWILFLLSIFCGGSGFGGGFFGRDNDCCGDNNCCMWLILILIFCGGNGFGFNNWGSNWRDNNCGGGCGC